MIHLDRIIAAGYVVRLSWVPSRRRIRALATLRDHSREIACRLDAYGETCAEATERLYAVMVTSGAVLHHNGKLP